MIPVLQLLANPQLSENNTIVRTNTPHGKVGLVDARPIVLGVCLEFYPAARLVDRIGR